LLIKINKLIDEDECDNYKAYNIVFSKEREIAIKYIKEIYKTYNSYNDKLRLYFYVLHYVLLGTDTECIVCIFDKSWVNTTGEAVLVRTSRIREAGILF